jgi:alpha-L-rhamnosidase
MIRGWRAIAAGSAACGVVGTAWLVAAQAAPLTTLAANGGVRQGGKPSARPVRLRCEYFDNPLGIDAAKPRLSWIIEAREKQARAVRQTAYQIIVSSTESLLAADRGDLWDSGKVMSDETTAIAYAGKPMKSRQGVWWKVKVWDEAGRDAGFSRPAYWEMGLLNALDWQAKWIGVPTSDGEASLSKNARWIWAASDGNASQSAPVGERFFRRQFDLPADRGFQEARITITADDQFTLYVNGREVGKSSGETDAWRKPLTVDIKPFLKVGANVIAVAARNTGNTPGPAGLAATLRVRFTGGGTPLELNTDRNWKANASSQDGWQNVTGTDEWPVAREVARMGQGPWGNPSGGGVGPGRYVRKTFTAKGAIYRARLYGTAMGIYEATINGKRVGNDVFAPGWTDYKKRVQYQTYDVTPLLKRGENAIGIAFADGWYAGHVGLAGRGVYGPTPYVCAQLQIEYMNGETEILGTDETWKGTVAGPVVTSDMLMGEVYDARKEMTGWDAPGFRDTNWTAAEVTTDVAVPREAERGAAVRRYEELPTLTVKQPKAGSYVFDVGQNLVGWARLKVKGPAGVKVTLRFAEMLNPDGTIYTTNYRSAKCTDEYILKGDRNGETFEPHFTFRGFRYVEVTGWPEATAPTPKAITGIVVHSNTPRVGTMETSSPMVNQLLKNIDWGQKGNFVSVPTDCPQRDERLGWMGDAQIFVRTATYNRDVAAFFHKWLVDVDDAQSPAGAFPDVAPRVAAGEGTAAWGDAGVICPWTAYIAYGDTRFLSDHYPAMVRWVEYCQKNSKELIRPAAGYGDWLSIKADTPKDLLATAYFAYSTKLTAKAARVLGKQEDAAKFEELFGQIKAAFNKAFVAEDGRVKGNTQTGYLLALSFDLLPTEKRAAAARHLTEDIASRNNHLSTGFVGVGYLCPTLTETGNMTMAYRLLNNETFPSWGYSIKQGATTIWERWDGWTHDKGFQDAGMNSFNHYSFGSVGEWLYGSVAGIDTDPAKPGYKHILIQPQPGGGLTYTRASYDSVRGVIATDWKQEPTRFLLNVTVPPNTTATVRIPATDASKVTESGKATAGATGITLLRADSGFVSYRVGSGTYRFEARK